MERQIYPACWLMTDERMGDLLWPALEAASEARAGIVFRHHRSPPDLRSTLAEQIATFTRERGLHLSISRDPALARLVGARLVHNPVGGLLGLPFSRAVHNDAEAHSARAEGASLVFVSPVYPTRSHPGSDALGEQEAARLAAAAGVTAYALGGVTPLRERRLRELGFAGWAAIDWWIDCARQRGVHPGRPHS